jgi:hypothetical protein
MSDYTVAITRFDSVSDRCTPVPSPPGAPPCHRKPAWTVHVTGALGASSTGHPVCGDHLFPALRHWLGLPSEKQ